MKNKLLLLLGCFFALTVSAYSVPQTIYYKGVWYSPGCAFNEPKNCLIRVTYDPDIRMCMPTPSGTIEIDYATETQIATDLYVAQAKQPVNNPNMSCESTIDEIKYHKISQAAP